MPRGRRLLVEGGLYHVYNRFSSGEQVFADPDEAIEFVGSFERSEAGWMDGVRVVRDVQPLSYAQLRIR